MVENLIVFLGTIVDAFCFLYLCERIFGRDNQRFCGFITYGGIAGVHILWSFLNENINNMYFVFADGIIVMFCLGFLYYGNIKKRIFLSLVITLLGSASEFLAYGMQICMNVDVGGDASYYLGMVLSKLFFMIGTAITGAVFANGGNLGGKRETATILICQGISALILCIMMYLFKDSNFTHAYILGIIGFLIIFLNMCIYFMLNFIADDARLREQELLIKESQEKTQEQYRLISEKYTQIRSIIHDTNKHLLTIAQMIEQKNYDEAIRYIQETRGEVNAAHQYVNTGNLAIDAMVNDMKQRCEEHHIECQMEVAVNNNEMHYPAHDLAIILGNVFDNAYHAVSMQKKDEKKIIVKIVTVEDKFILYVENGYQPEYEKKKSYGIRNIENMVEKHHGIYCVERKDGKYKTEIMLPM